MGNLLLAFPDLAPESFRPWVNESDARAAGLSVDEFAAKTAADWTEGLAAQRHRRRSGSRPSATPPS